MQETNVTILRDFANLNGYMFVHGREVHDFHNLIDADNEFDEQIKIMHWTKEIKPLQSNDTNFWRGRLYQGAMFCLVKSTFDDTIENGKYDKYVLPMLTEDLDQKFINYFCKGYDFEITSMKEVYNLFDVNMDGLWITYNLVVE